MSEKATINNQEAEIERIDRRIFMSLLINSGLDDKVIEGMLGDIDLLESEGQRILFYIEDDRLKYASTPKANLGNPFKPKGERD